jgi:hypothetical protein
MRRAQAHDRPRVRARWKLQVIGGALRVAGSHGPRREWGVVSKDSESCPLGLLGHSFQN